MIITGLENQKTEQKRAIGDQMKDDQARQCLLKKQDTLDAHIEVVLQRGEAVDKEEKKNRKNNHKEISNTRE